MKERFLSFGPIFCSFPPLTTQKIKILKKNAWRYHFTQVHHKRQSYDEWFPIREGGQTINFCHFDIFCLTPLNNPNNQKFEKMKKNP